MSERARGARESASYVRVRVRVYSLKVGLEERAT